MNPKESKEPFELEQQFILRLPPGAAMALRNALENNSTNIKDRLAISFRADKSQRGEIRFDGMRFKAKMLTLPCIVESLKTVDRKTFYKTADISQLLLCKNFEDASSSEDEPDRHDLKKKREVERRYLYPHGITHPLKNARKRRFRKTSKKSSIDKSEVEKELRRLFSADHEAIEVKFEIVDEDDTKSKSANEESMDMVAEDDLFGGHITSSDDDEPDIVDVNDDDDDDEDDDTKRGEMMGSMDMEEEDSSMPLPPISTTSSPRFDFSGVFQHRTGADGDSMEGPMSASVDDRMSPQMTEEEKEAIRAQVATVKEQLAELRQQKLEKEQEIAHIGNAALKMRLQVTLDGILQEESRKATELDELLATLDE